VWAFGVTAWEILTEGKIPYYYYTQEEKLVEHVCGGGRLSRAELLIQCNDSLWDIISSCWAHVAAERPTFKRLALLLVTTMGESIQWPVNAAQVCVRKIALLYLICMCLCIWNSCPLNAAQLWARGIVLVYLM
jgi:hypothetical protein